MSRSRRNAVTLAIVAAALFAAYAAAWLGVSRTQMGRSDFSAFYVGGTLVREGHLADLYSGTVQAAVHATLGAPAGSGNLPFVNPPPAALLMAPVSLLPFVAAYRAWQVLQVLLLVLAAVVVARSAPWTAAARRSGAPLAAAAAAVAGTGTLALGLLGQWDGLSALGIAGAYALWRRDRLFAGGAVLAATAALAKPHLALGLAAFLLGWRERRMILGALAGVAAVVLTSLLTVGPAGLAGLVSATGADASRWPLASMLGFTGFTGSWLGDGATSQVIALVGTVAACALCVVLGARLRGGVALEPTLAAATLLSLVASPHLLSQDLVLLAPMLVAMMAWASQRDRGSVWPGHPSAAVLGGWVALCLAAALDLGSQQSAPPGRLVPVALAALGVALAWRTRSRHPAPAAVAA